MKNDQSLRAQMRRVAEELGYEYRGHPDEKTPLGDVFTLGERTVQIGYTTNGSRVRHLRVNGDVVVPAGKWPTIEALKAMS